MRRALSCAAEGGLRVGTVTSLALGTTQIFKQGSGAHLGVILELALAVGSWCHLLNITMFISWIEEK